MPKVSESDFVVYGAGGHGAVVLDALLASGRWPLGIVDDRVSEGQLMLGVPVLGGDAWLAARRRLRVVLAIGSNAVRRRIGERCRELDIELLTVIHPRATVSSFAAIDAGAVVLAGAVVNPRARVGRGAIVNSGAVVEHDVVVAAFAHVSPNATLTGGASLGVEAQLGASACVLPGVAVGDYSLVGAGAVVTRSIPAQCVARGVPARVKRELVR